MAELTEHSEKELLEQVAAGDQQAFASLVDRYSRKVFTHLLTFVKSYEIAEELAQDVFMKIWKNRETLTDILVFEDYLFIVSRNHLVSYLRKKLPFPTVADADDAIEENLLLPNIHVELKELQQQLNKGIDRLRPQQQKVFRLSREEGLTYRQIAERLSLSQETVKWHLAEALNNLRTYMHEHGNLLAIAWIVFIAV